MGTTWLCSPRYRFSAFPICRKFDMHAAALAPSVTREYTGTEIATNTNTITTTTPSSISVNPALPTRATFIPARHPEGCAAFAR